MAELGLVFGGYKSPETSLLLLGTCAGTWLNALPDPLFAVSEHPTPYLCQGGGRDDYRFAANARAFLCIQSCSVFGSTVYMIEE